MTAAVTSAAVIAAGMAFPMMMVVMIALYIRVELQIAGYKSFHSGICIAGYTAEQPDPGCGQRHLGTAANAAADQHICIQGGEHTGQSAVAAAVGVHHLRCNDLTVLDIINLKLLGVTEVLEDHTVFISDCDSHNIFSFRFFILTIDSVLEAGSLAAFFRVTVA